MSENNSNNGERSWDEKLEMTRTAIPLSSRMDRPLALSNTSGANLGGQAPTLIRVTKVVKSNTKERPFVAKREGSTNSDFILPLSASIAQEDPVEISVEGGAYQVGVTGAWVTIPATEAAQGTHVYLVIEQDAARAVTQVTVQVDTAELDPVMINEGLATSNVLIAKLVTAGDPPASAIQQYRNGNFTLGLWQIDGDVVRWPETILGNIPPDA